MWRFRDQEEVRIQRKKKIWLPVRPFLISLVGFAWFFSNFKYGVYPLFDETVSWEYFWAESFEKVIFLSIFLFLILYAWQLLTKKPIGEKRMLICLQCNRIKNFDNDFHCECGGQFVNLYEVEWVEDKNE